MNIDNDWIHSNGNWKICVILVLYSVNLMAENIIHVTKPGTLVSCISIQQMDTCTSLSIDGKLNSDDICLLRRMAGANVDNQSSGKLEMLDLRKARFIKDKNPYLILDAAKENVVGNLGPDQWYALDDGWYSIPTKGNGSNSYPVNTGVMTYRPFYIICNGSYFNDSIKQNVMCVNFADSIKPSLHRYMSTHNMLHFTGHDIIRRNGRYFINAYLEKNTFCMDMFYGCKSIKAIALPKGMVMNDQVVAEVDNVRYYEFGKQKDNRDAILVCYNHHKEFVTLK